MWRLRRLCVSMLVVAALFGLTACGGGGNDATATVARGDGQFLETIVIRHGKPVGGVRDLYYVPGERIRLRVRSDVADTVYVHGYERKKHVPANGEVTFSIPTHESSVFAVYLEEREEQIAEVSVLEPKYRARFSGR